MSLINSIMPIGCIIRLEEASDRPKTENLVREAFWNVYRPGCFEHYLLHIMRDHPDFVGELSFVLEKDGEIIGLAVFVRAHIKADDGKALPILTMGPICISPELQRKGYGKLLLDYCLERATEYGTGAVLLEGNIEFYCNCGFTYARDYGIRYHGVPEDCDDSFFLIKELKSGYLDGITGEYSTPEVYFVSDSDVDEFDNNFPKKDKLKLPWQLF